MTIMRPLHRAQARLARQLVGDLQALLGTPWHLARHRQRDWASATFVGARHLFVWRGDHGTAPAEADRLADRIACHEFSLPGAFVAEARIADRYRDADGVTHLHVELLVIDDA
ncbi:MAG: hypothetical protein GW859_01120 [Sphingomonadales bacterium]|nr:hypothetical protein [Sphingomonadales bacterium]